MLKKSFMFLVILTICFCQFLTAQNVGIGTSSPNQKLEVNGAVKIGNTSTNNPGTIRYNSGKFEGGNGTDWKSFDGLPSKSIILVRARDTAEFISAGYEIFKESQIEDTIEFTNSYDFKGTWQGLSNEPKPDAPFFSNNFESVLYQNKLVHYDPGTGKLHFYSPDSDTWLILSTNSSGLSFRTFYSLTIVNNEIYVLGGIEYKSGLRSVVNDGAIYNPLTDTWTIIPVPARFAYQASCSFNNELWLFGGIDNIDSDPSIPYVVTPLRRVYKYYPYLFGWSSNIYSDNTPYLTSGNAHEYDGKIILVNTDSVTAFNPTSNTYTKLADVPAGGSRSFIVSEINEPDLYLLGEFDETINSVNTTKAMKQYRINLNGGSIERLNTCPFLNYAQPSTIGFTYKYSPSTNKFFYGFKDAYETVGFSTFSETGSESCFKTNTFNTKLYYMRKL